MSRLPLAPTTCARLAQCQFLTIAVGCVMELCKVCVCERQTCRHRPISQWIILCPYIIVLPSMTLKWHFKAHQEKLCYLQHPFLSSCPGFSSLLAHYSVRSPHYTHFPDLPSVLSRVFFIYPTLNLMIYNLQNSAYITRVSQNIQCFKKDGYSWLCGVSFCQPD